ncbi:hypothetical protein EVAR_37311_1 [Eumeta japonica]|uniref:Uncharacterized protein n=1 Tax=Eumeta variegata TaxID=151549 RepID=A0A4C1X1N9_EUMVA|nr:hypothetical protein EVAR_37311_1 [Eumeta japonica]
MFYNITECYNDVLLLPQYPHIVTLCFSNSETINRFVLLAALERNENGQEPENIFLQHCRHAKRGASKDAPARGIRNAKASNERRTRSGRRRRHLALRLRTYSRTHP